MEKASAGTTEPSRDRPGFDAIRAPGATSSEVEHAYSAIFAARCCLGWAVAGRAG